MNEQEKYGWMVYVSCMTFNHAPYIEDAMNGFTMQKTDFPFVCAIVDDVSTDGEQDVIKNYLNEHFDLEDKKVARHEETDDYVLTFARHKTNINCFFAVFYLKYNHYSIRKSKQPYLAKWQDNAKYIAICEGDDYWIDPTKLQKQVNYLESHSDYVLVHSNFTILYGKSRRIKHNGSGNYKIHEGNVTNTLFNGCWIRTPTVCYRNIDYNLDVTYPQGMFKGDIFLFYMLSLKGKFHFMKEETCVYRIVEGSVSHQTSEDKRWAFNESLRKLDYFMADYVNTTDDVRNKIDCKWFVNEFKHSLFAGDYSYYKSLKYDKLILPSSIGFCYNLCRVRTVFHVLSYLLRIKNRIRQRLIRINW